MAGRPHSFSPGREVDLMMARELLGPSGRTSPAQPPGLQTCPSCGLDFVVPGEIRVVLDDDRVLLDLDCANCGWSDTAAHDDRALARLDFELDRSHADLLWALEMVWVANEQAAIATFAAALTADAILPEDF
jgi:hypothetical protein